MVYFFPQGGVGKVYFFVVILSHMATNFAQTAMFVSSSAFHTQIADPLIGGTYMTTLNTVLNLAGTFPRFFVLQGIDKLTRAQCYILPDNALSGKKKVGSFMDRAEPMFSCDIESERRSCTGLGGRCVIEQDGYFVVGILCILIGTLLFVSFIRPTIQKLQSLPQKSWRVYG